MQGGLASRGCRQEVHCPEAGSAAAVAGTAAGGSSSNSRSCSCSRCIYSRFKAQPSLQDVAVVAQQQHNQAVAQEICHPAGLQRRLRYPVTACHSSLCSLGTWAGISMCFPQLPANQRQLHHRGCSGNSLTCRTQGHGPLRRVMQHATRAWPAGFGSHSIQLKTTTSTGTLPRASQAPQRIPRHLPDPLPHHPVAAPPARCRQVHQDEPDHCGAPGLPPLHQEVREVRTTAWRHQVATRIAQAER